MLKYTHWQGIITTTEKGEFFFLHIREIHGMFSHLPQGGWHGEHTEDEVRYGQGDDEDVPGRAHVLPSQDGPHDQEVPAQAHDDEGGVDKHLIGKN